MSAEFTKCIDCGIIFPNPGKQSTQCSRCRPDFKAELSDKDKLRMLRGILRDVQTAGHMLTIPELAQRSAVAEVEIWQFIRNGDIDTASFSDPDVRSYVQRQRLAAERENRKAVLAAAAPEPARSPVKRSGFHNHSK